MRTPKQPAPVQRVILHVDMDAFFAAVEQREHPEWRGKPVIVGADPKEGQGRGVVSTCSYEARVFGVRSAMPISQAYRLCPHGIYVRPNGKLYSRVSREIFEIFYEFTDAVEPISIDEAFLDVTGSLRLFGSGVSIARQIKQRIWQKERLTASIGIAPNKYLAKIASDLKKPDGLVVVTPGEEKRFLKPLKIERLWGVGQKTTRLLHDKGVHTIGQLADLPLEVLTGWFGERLALHFFQLAHGIDDRPVHYDSQVKSVSNEHTFEKDVADEEILLKTLLRLCEKVGFRIRQKEKVGKTVFIKLRYQNFSTLIRNRTLSQGTNNTREIFEVASALFAENYQKGRKVRLLGVGLSNLQNATSAQLSLFDQPTREKRLNRVEDEIKKKYGPQALQRAELLSRRSDKK